MKKSFKKAGAAVLSMSMLLAMGAVTMPVYADNYTNTYKPAQVEVTIALESNAISGGNENGTVNPTLHQDDNKNKYDYLSNIDNATVKMYRVATLTGNEGWKWDTRLATALTTVDSTNDYNSTAVETDFEKLLERVVAKTENGSVQHDAAGNVIYEDTDNHDAADAYPKLNSDQLQALAAKLERILVAHPEYADLIATGTVEKTPDGHFTSAYLPTDDDVYTVDKTRDIRGYYLIVTETPEAGVIFQPVLIPLKNDTATDDADKTVANHASIKKVALKGTNITIDKDILDVKSKLNEDGKQITKYEEEVDKVYREAGAVAGSKDTAIVGKSDFITYQIHAELPNYDKNLASDAIKTFTITDTPDQGIDIIAGYDSSSKLFAGVRDTGASDTARNQLINVYYSADETLVKPGTGTTTDVKLDENVDYKIVKITGTDGKADGFRIEITGLQLRGEVKDGTIKDNAVSVLNTTEPAIATMEKGHIFVEFDARINDELNRAYHAQTKPLSKITATDLAAAGIVTTKPTAPAVVADPGEDGSETDKAAYQAYLTAKANYDADMAEYKAYKDADPTKFAADAFESTVNTDDLKKQAIVYYNKQNAATEALNGNKNVATMRYGNSFSTGKGDGESSDTTKVYSVDLNLTKVVVDNLIRTETTEEQTVIHYVKNGSIQSAKGGTALTNKDGNTLYVKADGVTITTDKTQANGYVDEDTADGDLYVLTAIEETTDVADAQVNAPASGGTPATYWYIDLSDSTKHVTTTTASGGTETIPAGTTHSDYTKTDVPVVGAVFKLTHTYTANGTESEAAVAGTPVVESYAASDSSGRLMLLTPGTKTQTETKISGSNVYVVVEKDDDNVTWYTPYTMSTQEAWTELTIGEYKLEEVYAPTGFKKWSSVATLNIQAKSDIAGTEATKWTSATGDNTNFTGEFRGYSSDSVFVDNDDDPTTAPAYFTFANTTDTVGSKTIQVGELRNNITNTYDDRLPATGGMGTVLFTAGGIAVVLMAGALFVMYMKKRNAEDEE